jgi:hypothetical protein
VGDNAIDIIDDRNNTAVGMQINPAIHHLHLRLLVANPIRNPES